MILLDLFLNSFETCSYESFEGFHARFEIFGFLYEQ